MSNVLAVVEQRDGVLRGTAREIMTAATRLAAQLGGEAEALVLGGIGVEGVQSELARYGAVRVNIAQHEALASYHPEGYAVVVQHVVQAGGYAAVLFAATGAGKDLAPRVAAALDVPLAADVIGLEGAGGQVEVVRPIYAGKAFARIGIEATPAMVSLRPNVFQPVESPVAGAVVMVSVSEDVSKRTIELRSFEPTGGDIPDVSEASIVVAGGRGLREAEHWALLEDLRAALGSDAGLGASRAVVDAGWRPHGEQVGQTGKTVAPKLYFAIGISGAIQHLAGMRTAGTIVAVNRDPDAPIFKVADYGIVGDLFEVLPRLTDEVKRLRAQG